MHSFKKLIFIVFCVVYMGNYCVLRGRIKGFNSSITAIMYQVGSYRTVVGSYRMVVLLTHFYQRKIFVYSISVLNFNDSISTPTH